MPGTETKNIIGEVRYALTMHLKQQYPNMDGAQGFLQTTEGYLIRTLYGIDVKDVSPDYYIAPGDGGGPILVDVGDTGGGNWDALTWKDGTAVRVLHVGLDGRLDLLRPRHTQFETDLLNVLTQCL